MLRDFRQRHVFGVAEDVKALRMELKGPSFFSATSRSARGLGKTLLSDTPACWAHRCHAKGQICLAYEGLHRHISIERGACSWHLYYWTPGSTAVASTQGVGDEVLGLSARPERASVVALV